MKLTHERSALHLTSRKP